MTSETTHGSAVAVAGRGCLIVGRPGAGKSTLAIELISAGAILVADDRTVVTRTSRGVTLSAPEALQGLIEARGVGIIRLRHTSAPLALIVDLDRHETSRLPPRRHRHLAGSPHPVILGKGRAGLAAILALSLADKAPTSD